MLAQHACLLISPYTLVLHDSPPREVRDKSVRLVGDLGAPWDEGVAKGEVVRAGPGFQVWSGEAEGLGLEVQWCFIANEGAGAEGGSHLPVGPRGSIHRRPSPSLRLVLHKAYASQHQPRLVGVDRATRLPCTRTGRPNHEECNETVSGEVLQESTFLFGHAPSLRCTPQEYHPAPSGLR